tara:strand:- start:561 stop:1310 length:750 start_codon:yes stop_codon:yes gene_type:complete
MPRPKPVLLIKNKGTVKDYFKVPTDYVPRIHYILTRSTKYEEGKVPEIAFFGINEGDIRSYMIGNNYYQWKIPKKYGKIINLYSDKAQQIIGKLDYKEKRIVEKALTLGTNTKFTKKYIRVSEDKKDDIEAFKIIKDLFPGYIGSFTPGKDGNPLKHSDELSHNEIVLWDKIPEINRQGELININQINSFNSFSSLKSLSSSSLKSLSSSSSSRRKRTIKRGRRSSNSSSSSPRTPRINRTKRKKPSGN